jgi:pilus assembly protein CpaF
MRPDRIVVGEVRGAEVADLLLALNTGHDGGATTVHANGVHEVPARLEALGALAGLPRAALHSQMAAALDVVIHVTRADQRRVTGIAVLERGPDGLVAAVPALQRDSEGWQVASGAAALRRRLHERGTSPPAILAAL